MNRTTMRRLAACVATAAAALATAAPARAAVAQRSFTFTFGDFRSGFGNQPPPIEELSGTLTVTTNFAADGTNQTGQVPDAFRLQIGSRTFTEADVVFSRQSFPQGVYLSFDYAVTPNSLNTATYDFGMGFRYDEGLGPRFGQLAYTVPQSANYFQSSSGLVSEVPEPESWVVLLTGFGAAGQALRSRRRPAAAAAA